MLRIILGVVYIIGAIYVGIYTFNNRCNMPSLVRGLNEENYEVTDKTKFNKIMIIKNALECIWILFSGVLCIIYNSPSVVALPSLYFIIDIIFSKIAKKYINIK
ncbi:hypothetical protein [Clostridium sp. HMP27]|uniref:hypothetical protein n=1 Tax=Clostridium sp. HMP27 TaxID=1487921 RepID=UPI00052C87FF|nr:hypothetical protein [Clostridium sp. HMP27]KGK86609.1 hypothetical protein DP68_13465 [Clostridium sp. HMP27]